MGKGGKGRGWNQGKQPAQWVPQQQQWMASWAEKGPKAIGFAETYHCALLRAYPGEQGEVLIKRGAARRELHLLTLEGVACCEKWLSMLAASVRQAHRVLPFALEEPKRTGIPQLGAALSDELLAAATLLDTTQKQVGDGEEVRATVQLLLQHVAQDELLGHFQRTAVYSASLYIYAMQALQAGPVEQKDFFFAIASFFWQSQRPDRSPSN